MICRIDFTTDTKYCKYRFIDDHNTLLVTKSLVKNTVASPSSIIINDICRKDFITRTKYYKYSFIMNYKYYLCHLIASENAIIIPFPTTVNDNAEATSLLKLNIVNMASPLIINAIAVVALLLIINAAFGLHSYECCGCKVTDLYISRKFFKQVKSMQTKILASQVTSQWEQQ